MEVFGVMGFIFALAAIAQTQLLKNGSLRRSSPSVLSWKFVH